MSKYCPNCGAENPEDAFWCRNCDKKLFETQSVLQKISEEKPPKPLPERQETYKSFDQYESRAIKVFIIGFVIIIAFIGIFMYFNVSNGSDFPLIDCQINEDFWFEEDKIITNDGWTFKMVSVGDYTLDGVVLAFKEYNRHDSPYDPCNIFCPIDLFIGIDDVKNNPDMYDYSITSFNNRQVFWYMRYDDVSDYHYFKSHTGNNHLIPHNQEVLYMMKNISVKDRVLIKGSLVNLYGSRGDESLFRPTDTHIGNYNCEVILVEELIIV